jgi:hypothetical protein
MEHMRKRPRKKLKRKMIPKLGYLSSKQRLREREDRNKSRSDFQNWQ